MGAVYNRIVSAQLQTVPTKRENGRWVWFPTTPHRHSYKQCLPNGRTDGRCGLQLHRIGTVTNSAYQTGERTVGAVSNRTDLQCPIN